LMTFSKIKSFFTFKSCEWVRWIAYYIIKINLRQTSSPMIGSYTCMQPRFFLFLILPINILILQFMTGKCEWYAKTTSPASEILKK
jgi:hypothetical protein